MTEQAEIQWKAINTNTERHEIHAECIHVHTYTHKRDDSKEENMENCELFRLRIQPKNPSVSFLCSSSSPITLMLEFEKVRVFALY